MELKIYLEILARRWRIALLVTIVTFCAAVLGNQFISPTYQAETILRIDTPLGGWADETSYQTTYATRLMNTYAQIATSEKVMNELKANLNLTNLPDISVDIIPDSEIIKITVKSEGPALAASSANKLAELLISYQDQALDSTDSNELSILTNRVDELEAELAQKQSEYDQLVQTCAEKTAEITILEREIQTKEGYYQNLMNRYLENTVSEAVYTNARTRETEAVLSQEIDRVQGEIDLLNKQYKELLTDSNKCSQQVIQIRESIGNIQNVYSDLQDQYGTALVNTNRQENARRIIIVSPAFEPTTPEGPGRQLILGLELIFGIMVGIAAAFVVDVFKDNVETKNNASERPTNLESGS